MRRQPKPEPRLAEAAKAVGTPRKKAVAAGPKSTVPSQIREAAERSVLDRTVAVVTDSLSDDKAEDVVVLDLAGRASFADRMVVATGLADRQISAMAAHLEERIRAAGLGRVQIEGSNGSDWVLIDVGDVVIHLFKAEARALYGLERMWGAEFDEASTSS